MAVFQKTEFSNCCAFLATSWLETLAFKMESAKRSEYDRPILLEWKTSPADSTGFRVQLLSTENKRYQKNTPNILLSSTEYFHITGCMKYNHNQVLYALRYLCVFDLFYLVLPHLVNNFR